MQSPASDYRVHINDRRLLLGALSAVAAANVRHELVTSIRQADIELLVTSSIVNR